MDDGEFDEALNYLLYGEYPANLKGSSKNNRKNFRRKMGKKYKLDLETRKVYYHINTKV
jgi:hypothetical protein